MTGDHQGTAEGVAVYVVAVVEDGSAFAVAAAEHVDADADSDNQPQTLPLEDNGLDFVLVGVALVDAVALPEDARDAAVVAAADVEGTDGARLRSADAAFQDDEVHHPVGGGDVAEDGASEEDIAVAAVD